jgi:cephalosporin-C deacetylase-like acetyl esterase
MILGAVAAAGSMQAGSAGPVLKIETDRESAVYARGEKALFRISLRDASDAAITGKAVTVTLAKGAEHTEQVLTTAAVPVEAAGTLDHPGFVLCTATCTVETGKTLRAQIGAAFDPLEIRQSRPAPGDFDAFWNGQKARLAKVPMNPRLAPLEAQEGLAGKVEAFDLKLDCVGDVPVSGYFARPVGAQPKSLPALLCVHGAGVRSSIRQDRRASTGVLALDINAHGIENGKPDSYYKELASGKLAGYSSRVADSPEAFYFCGMFLRALRALEFLKAQPEWNGRTLAVFGSSQGGAQALAAAGLDSQVTFCAAMVPAMCDHLCVLRGETGTWSRFVKVKDGKVENPEVLRVVPYFDCATFASRIRAETFINVGFIDGTCPPATVYAAYNNIRAPKRITNHPRMGHEYNDAEADRLVTAHLAAGQ